MNTHPVPEIEKDNSGTGAQRALQPSLDSSKDERRAPLIDLPAEETALALELLALSENTRPDEDFVNRLEGELTRKRLASRPRRAVAPTLAERMRLVLQSAWGWTVPAGAVILIIVIISLLMQVRPRQTMPSGEITTTSLHIETTTPTPLPPFIITPISAIAPAATVSPTPVPPGIFVMMFYPPLVLDYDPLLWSDESQYTNTERLVNYLQARDLETCQLGPQLHSGFYPSPDEIVTLGNIRYQVTTLNDTPPGRTTSYYIDADSLAGYNYAEKGVIVFTLSASPSEWDACKILAEPVLASLHLAVSPVATPGISYVVQEGDTLLEIAKSYGISPDVIYEANDLLKSEGVLRPGMTLIIPLEEATTTPSTPIPPSATPSSATQALLDELQELVARRTADLLVSPGWVHLHTMRTAAATCGSLLPNGVFNPCEFEDDSWYELDAQGEVVTVITRQLDPSANLFQESVTRDGLTRNLTFGYEMTVPLTSTYVQDRGFAAEAAQALGRGASLTQAYNSIDGEYTHEFILLLVEGDWQREAVFDPLTGGLLSLSTWKYEVDEFGEGLTLIASVKVLEEVWVEQPTEYALSLLDQPTPPYQPLQPQGEPVPSDFDLAHSILSFQTLAGDAFYDPSFWYGDIYADSIYLVGRVDFGADPGGFCQRSPDGTRLAFDRATFSDEAPAVHQVRWLELPNPSVVYAVLPELQLVSPPVWGSDSTRLAFTACDAAQDCGFYAYDTGSGSLQRLAEGGNATPPVWSPDGVEIAYQTGDGASSQTVVVDAVSGMEVASPGWQPQFYNWSGYSQCEVPPALAPTLPAAPADWLVYTNPEYGFSFHYPPDWTLQELTQTVQLAQGDITFTISFRRPDEPSAYLRTGMPAGDFLHGGHVSFFGQSLPRYLLWYEDKVKVIVHSMGTQISRGGILFVLSLDDFSLDYDAIDLSTELQQQVSQMIESFTWIPVPPPQSEPTVTPTAQPSVLVVTAATPTQKPTQLATPIPSTTTPTQKPIPPSTLITSATPQLLQSTSQAVASPTATGNQSGNETGSGRSWAIIVAVGVSGLAIVGYWALRRMRGSASM